MSNDMSDNVIDGVKSTDRHRKAVTGVASSGPILLPKPDRYHSSK